MKPDNRGDKYRLTVRNVTEEDEAKFSLRVKDINTEAQLIVEGT